MKSGIDVVTGSFSYTGQYITRRLLAAGRGVRTLTGHPDPHHPLAKQVTSLPYDFGRPNRLVESLRGAEVLYNTYWVRFPHGRLTYDVAVKNLQCLILAAKQAGVRKIVHVSIINPAEDSPYPYFRAKARVERIIQDSGIAYTILRPTVVFGSEDILINNMAWLVRSFPVFPVPGDGNCLLQPISVDDLSRLAVEAGRAPESGIMDAAGPDMLTYRSLIRQIAGHLGREVRVLGVPARVAYFAGKLIGAFLHDVVLTYEEILALRSNALFSLHAPRGTVGINDWLEAHKDEIGREYRSELKRHFQNDGIT
jgi:NADH dehydrogenase